MDISDWIKSKDVRNLFDEHGFGVAGTTNYGFSVLLKKDGCLVEIPNGVFDDPYDIKQSLLSLSRITGASVVDLFLSHDNVLKRIFERAITTGGGSKVSNTGDGRGGFKHFFRS